MSETPRRNLLALGAASTLMGGLGLITGQALAVPASAPTFADPGDDAALLALGQEHAAAWAAERQAQATAENMEDREAAEALIDDALDTVGEIVDQILETPAVTLDGLKVKARAFLWAMGDGVIDMDEDGSATTDVCLATSIVRDLLAMEGIAHA